MEHHPFFMGKSTISFAMFNSYFSLPEGKANAIAVRLWCKIDMISWSLNETECGKANAINHLCYHLRVIQIHPQ